VLGLSLVCLIALLATPTSNIAMAMGLRDQALSPLTAEAGDTNRGRNVFLDRDKGHCILCHAVPEPSVRFSGDLGPPLHGVGARLSVAQLRFRVIDASRLSPDTIMPAYHRSEDLNRVAPEVKGKPILSAQEVEDIVAYLATLK
jgi:L-cysteine S-thiosulfotransferase